MDKNNSAKIHHEKLIAYRNELLKKMNEHKKKREEKFIPTPPRYDEVFFDGVAWLDTL